MTNKEKILLIGEFSGLHTNLSSGLKQLGYDVVIASSGDGKKKFSRDIDLSLNFRKKPIKSIANIIRFLIVAKKFDVVQFIYPVIFPIKLNSFLLRLIVKRNKKSFFVAAGTDYCFITSCKKFRYNPYVPMLQHKEFGFSDNIKYLKNWGDELLRISDGVIPVMYEYAIGYEGSNKKLNTVPLPVDLKDIVYQENKVTEKIIIVYGRTRPGFKGEEHIMPALSRIQKDFDHVEVRILEGLSSDEYINELKSCNILIDQCNSYSYGMNAIFGLALGKLVFSGNEVECRNEFKREIPIVNIVPDENAIFETISNYLEPCIIEEKGMLGREFVESFHDATIVAEKYIENWTK